MQLVEAMNRAVNAVNRTKPDKTVVKGSKLPSDAKQSMKNQYLKTLKSHLTAAQQSRRNELQT